MIPDTNEWKYLPDLVLEQIYSYLTWHERLQAACTCRPWNQTFYNPGLWKSFTYRPPHYLEKYSQRIYYDIATYNLSNCFKAVGYCFQTVIISQISDFFILNRALNVIGDFYRNELQLKSVNNEQNPVFDFRSKLEYFSFEFASQIENGAAYGTGGALLGSIKKLLDVLSGLREVRVTGLLLDEKERRGLLDAFINHNLDSLRWFSLVDVGKTPLCEYGIVRLHCLRYLELGVCEIDADLLIHLVQETRLDELVLTQTRFTLLSVEFVTVSAIGHHVWQLANEINPNLKLHQRYLLNNIPDFVDLSTVSIIYQPTPAPVSRFVFTSNNTSLLDLDKLYLYHSTLTELILIVVDPTTNSIHRLSIDNELLQVVDNCRHLDTLVIGGERLLVFAATILQLVHRSSTAIKHLWIDERTVMYSIQNMSTDLFNSYISNEVVSDSSNAQSFVANIRSQLHLPDWDLLDKEQFFSLVDKMKYVL